MGEGHPPTPTPMPDSLARHVVSHNMRDEHLNERNRLIAVMLMTSLLQTVQRERGTRADTRCVARRIQEIGAIRPVLCY